MNVHASARRTFSSLSNPNYRKFFFGQTTSLIGTWMQTTAQSWLVFTLTHSATDIGFVVALQTLPVLILGPYGGVIADRVDKRRLMIGLQSMMGLQAAALAILSILHVVTYLDVCLLAVVLGLNNAFENPSRQAFVLEMVGPDNLRNAVSLNSTMNNVARAVGPAIAGVLIAWVGEGWCFALNALSFIAVVASLVAMDRSSLNPSTPTIRAKGQLRRRLSLRRQDAQVGDSPRHDGPRGHVGLRVPSHAPHRRRESLSRQFRHLRAVAGGHGRGCRDRRTLDGRARKDGIARTISRGTRLWSLHDLRRVGSAARNRVRRDRGRWFCQRDVLGDGQLDTSTEHRPSNARPGHGAVGSRLHGIDAHWWTAHWMDHQLRRGESRTRRRSGVVFRGLPHRMARSAPPSSRGSSAR